MDLNCADCGTTFLLTPDGLTQGGACPNCGGKRLERDQPSPTHSDGDLRNMVDPSTGVDQGGNPNQEGIFGQVDGGWQTYRKRDESFASVSRTLNMEPYMPWTHEASLHVVAGPLALLAEPLAAAAPALMRGALMGIGSHAIGGLFGGGGGGEAPQAEAAPQAPRGLDAVSRTADMETPTSYPALHDSPDGDTQQFKDESTSTAFQNPNRPGEGGSQQGEDETHTTFMHDSPGIERMQMLLPLLMHYHQSPESAANDPMLAALHEQLERENPGYLQKVGPEHEDALEGLKQRLRQPDAIHAHTGAGVFENTPMNPAQQAMVPGQGQMQQGVFPGTQPGQGRCPFCGGTTAGDGSCPQCGAKTNPQGGATPPGFQPGMGIAQPSMPFTGAYHQGPITKEQIAGVQQLLIQEGRIEEVPNVVVAPWDYADELARLTNQQDTAPNVDPTEAPPPPAAPPQEMAPPGATMPVPNPGDPSMAPTARVAADSVTERCPNCGSATTGILGQQGDGTTQARCHACQHVWEVGAVREKIGAGENVVGVPAAEQDAPDHNVQDTTRSWATPDGAPLEEGQTYELHSPKYAIPDLVRIEKIKPDSLEVSTIGEYQAAGPGAPQDGEPLTYKREIPREEAQVEKLQFVPSDGQAGEQSVDQYQNQSQAPVNTEPQQTPNVPEHSAISSVEVNDSLCPRCASEHISSSMSSATTNFHECFRCGHGWETKEEDYSDEHTASREWIMGDSGPSGDDFWSGYERAQKSREAGTSRSLSDIARRDDRLQAVHDMLEENRMEREAGKKFTPREQRNFIDEDGVARNADKLDLAGTHYESRHRYLGDKANGDNVREEDLFLGF